MIFSSEWYYLWGMHIFGWLILIVFVLSVIGWSGKIRNKEWKKPFKNFD